MTIRVVLVDDHPIVLKGLISVLALEPDIVVEASCTSGEQALREVAARRPDVLLLDIGLPDLSGIEVLRRLREQELPVRVVLFAAVISDEQALEALHLRADGILLKELAARFIVSCIRKVHSGGRWLETGSSYRAFDLMAASQPARDAALGRISAREREIVRLVVAGLSNKQIAARLFLSEGTVKSHLHHLYEKLEVRTRLQLAALARDSHFV